MSLDLPHIREDNTFFLHLMCNFNFNFFLTKDTSKHCKICFFYDMKTLNIRHFQLDLFTRGAFQYLDLP